MKVFILMQDEYYDIRQSVTSIVGVYKDRSAAIAKQKQMERYRIPGRILYIEEKEVI